MVFPANWTLYIGNALHFFTLNRTFRVEKTLQAPISVLINVKNGKKNIFLFFSFTLATDFGKMSG